MITVCIPTLNSYDTLESCLESISKSSIDVHTVVLDNGGNFYRRLPLRTMVIQQPYNLGVAGSWNWFIDHVEDIRIISNDDIVFDQYAIEKLVEALNKYPNSLLFPENLGSCFSCFILPQTIIDTIGKFDETLAPNYGYFEDNDYFYRMQLAGFGTSKATGSLVEHVGSSTLRHFSPSDEQKHHERFRASRERYIRKWGGEPTLEKYKTPYGK